MRQLDYNNYIVYICFHTSIKKTDSGLLKPANIARLVKEIVETPTCKINGPRVDTQA